MILLVHMLFGAAIGSVIHNAFLAIILALLGHYFLDLFPHIEYSIDNIREKNWRKSLPDILKVFLDFCLAIIIILLFSKNQLIIYICVFVSLVPDGLTIISSLLSNKFLLLHDKIHIQKVHFLRYKKTRALNELSARPSTKNILFSALVSIPFRILTQAIAIFISIVLISYQ